MMNNRFSNASSFGVPSGLSNLQNTDLGKTSTIVPPAMEQFDTDGNTGMANNPMAGASDAYQGLQGMPPPGSSADPYSMSSYTAGGVMPDYNNYNPVGNMVDPGPYQPSPAPTDPYAPGGAFAYPSNPANQTTSMVPKNMPNEKWPSPQKMPRWVRWAVFIAILGLLLALIWHAMSAKSKSKPSPPRVTCPPTPECPKPEKKSLPDEIIVRSSKDQPLVVKVDGQMQQVKQQDETPNKPAPQTPPVVIVNEANPSPDNVMAEKRTMPLTNPDNWGVTYAEGPEPFQRKASGTNMVFTTVGGPM